MTQQEKYVMYDILMRLVDNDQVLTPLERRDMMRQIFYQVCKINIDDFLGASRGQRALRPARGDGARNDAYVGQNGEITVDTENKTLRVHDGETPGGVTMARMVDIPNVADADYVIEWQSPTAENNYTWYRKYKSGWVEQGGIESVTGYAATTTSDITLPITMLDTNYVALSTINHSGENVAVACQVHKASQTNISLRISYNAKLTRKISWMVCGMSA